MRPDFQAFALAFYARPGVAPLCLKAQDEKGWDVVLLLYGLWRGGVGDAEAGAAAALSAEWAGRVVRPLRKVRREMKSPFAEASPQEAEAARAQLKALELTMELRQIAMLEALAAGFPPAPAAPAETLARLAAASGAKPLSPEEITALTAGPR